MTINGRVGVSIGSTVDVQTVNAIGGTITICADLQRRVVSVTSCQRMSIYLRCCSPQLAVVLSLLRRRYIHRRIIRKEAIRLK